MANLNASKQSAITIIIKLKSMFLISISALLMVIGLAETQKPPGLAQTSLSSKAFLARNFQSQQSRNSQINGQTSTSITYPDWDTWKRQFNKSYSPSEEAKAKQIYILNVMFMIENSFLDFNSDGSITNRFDISPLSFISYGDYTIPTFEYDFLSVFKKNYNSASEKAYRKSVFEQNAALLPANTYWSDWTTDEFNSILPAKLITYKTGNAVIQRALGNKENILLRSQKSQGPDFEQSNLANPYKQQSQQQTISRQQKKQSARIPTQVLQLNGRI